MDEKGLLLLLLLCCCTRESSGVRCSRIHLCCLALLIFGRERIMCDFQIDWLTTRVLWFSCSPSRWKKSRFVEPPPLLCFFGYKSQLMGKTLTDQMHYSESTFLLMDAWISFFLSWYQNITQRLTKRERRGERREGNEMRRIKALKERPWDEKGGKKRHGRKWG